MSKQPVVRAAAVSRQTRLTAVIVACALFMQNLDSTIIATALPTMARSFGYDPVRMNVALTSYLLSLTVFIPASGWVADRYGSRNVFRMAVVVFTAGSIWCGLSSGLPELVAARVLQGLGGAMMVPVGRLLLLRTAAKTELVAAMAWLTMPALIGPVVGPPLGGFIVTYFDWRWTFFINIPVGIVGIIAVSLYIKDFREPPKGRFDLTGFLWSGLAMVCAMAGMETVARDLVPVPVTLGLVAAGFVFAFAYFAHARRTAAPLLDFTLLRQPSFGLSISAMMLFRTGIGAVPFLLPMMLQVGFGEAAVQSGLITFASSAGALVMKPAAQYALRMFGFRDTLIWNGILSAFLLAICALFRPTWPAAAIYLALLAGGFFRSLQFTALNTLAYSDVPRPQMSAATSLYTCGQQLAATIGVTIGALSLELARIMSHHVAPQNTDFSVAFLVVAGLTLFSVPFGYFLPAGAGDDLTGRKPVPATPAKAAPRAGGH